MDTVVYDPYREALRAASGMSLRELASGKDLSAYLAFERGELTEDEYWDSYAAQGVVMDVEAFHAERLGGYRWLDGMETLTAEVAGRTATAVASNYSVWIVDLARFTAFADVVVSSTELGVRKPEGPFYDAVAAGLSVDPAQVVFVDDRQHNVDGAIAAGMDGVLFTDAVSLRTELTHRGVLLV